MIDISDGIRKHLDISTGHIPRKDNDVLSTWNDINLETETSHNGNCFCALIVVEHSYGYNVFVPEKDIIEDPEFTKTLKKEGLSDNFVQILEAAAREDCVFINFDADGTVIDGLESFDW